LVYLEFDFIVSPLEPGREILIAELSNIGFESFVENEKGLLAYVLEEDFSQLKFDSLHIFNTKSFELSYSKKSIVQQNWNAQWEKSFEPIVVEERCRVRAPFHSPKDEPYDIIIEPKMSFGTGHHETTYMMLQHILEHDFKQKTVLDMGCGTGVLAILAEKRGASKIEAIDIDSWCVENTTENIKKNNCKSIHISQGSVEVLGRLKYDVILANINRNILLEQIPKYTQCLTSNGILFMSGFYKEDLPIISEKCTEFGLQFEKNLQKNEWVSAKYVF
jgi:ribosomal protein L11 methyltransferase